MKKIYVILAAAAMVLCAASCNKDLGNGTKKITLNASMAEFAPDTKTTINPSNGKVTWRANDQILVVDENGKTATLVAEIVPDTNNAQAIFSGEADESFGTVQYAFYPAAKFKNVNAGAKTVELTLDSTPCVGEITGSKNPSFAEVTGNGQVAKFKNICGILNINQENIGDSGFLDYDCVLTANSVIAGDFVFNYADGSLVPAQRNTTKSMGISKKGQQSLSLYFIVPEGSFADGMKVVATTKHPYGMKGKETIESTKNNAIKASTIKVMPTLEWTPSEDDWTIYCDR